MNRKFPTIKQLGYFVTLEEKGHFGRAAQACFVSQSAFSVAIKDLESCLGLRLVDRTNRSVTITPEGREFAERARGILGQLEALVEMTRGVAEPLTGSLKLGVIPTLAPYVLPVVLPLLRKQYPKLQLYLREEQTTRIYEELLAGELDLLLLALPWELHHAQTLVLGSDRFLLAYREGTEKVDPQNYDVAKLGDGTVLLLEDGHCLRDHALSACNLHGSNAISRFKASSLQTLVQMVDADLGITFVPEIAIGSPLLSGTRIQLQALESSARRDIGIAWRRGSAREKEFRLFGEFVGNTVLGKDNLIVKTK